MTHSVRRDRHFRPVQPLSLLALLLAASLSLAGCGSSGADNASDGSQANSGGRSFVPEKPLMVAEANLDPKDLQTSLDTLKRLPAWGFVKTQIPGKGTAHDIFTAAAKDIELKDDKKASYTDDIEPWLGDHAGVAVMGGRSYKDLKHTDKGGYVAWIDADDEAKARTFVSSLKDAKKHDVDGSEGWRIDGDTTVVVNDGALLITATDNDMKQVIAAHDDGKTVEGDMLRLLDRKARTEQLSFAVDAEHGLKLAADAVENETASGTRVSEKSCVSADAESTGRPITELQVPCDDTGEQSDSLTPEQGKRVAAMMRSDAVTDLLPDVVGFSTGVDGKGVWMDFTWSGAGEQTDSLNARKLAGMMPDDVIMAAGSVSDGEFDQHIPELWNEIEKAGDFKLADLAKSCPAENAALCKAAIQYVTPMLTTDLLEKQSEKTGDVGIAYGLKLNAIKALSYTQGTATGSGSSSAGGTLDSSNDGTGIPPITPVKNGPVTKKNVRPVPKIGGNSGIAGPSTPGASAVPPFKFTIGAYEVAEHPDGLAEVVADSIDRLKPVARTVGITLTTAKTENGSSLVVQVDPKSKLGTSLKTMRAEDAQGLGVFGLSRDALLGSGQVFTAQKVEDGWLTTLPDGNAEPFVDALKGDGDLASNDDFKRDLKASGVPDKTTMLQWQDFAGMVDQLLQMSPETARVSGLVSNNLDHVGGIVTFTTREGSGDDRIGVATVSIPLYE